MKLVASFVNESKLGSKTMKRLFYIIGGLVLLIVVVLVLTKCGPIL